MPLIYETTAKIAEDGNFQIELKDFDFVKGMNFLVKLIPQPKFDPKKFRKNMQAMIDRFAENNPYKDMTKEQILADLRRQREEMYAEADADKVNVRFSRQYLKIIAMQRTDNSEIPLINCQDF